MTDTTATDIDVLKVLKEIKLAYDASIKTLTDQLQRRTFKSLVVYRGDCPDEDFKTAGLTFVANILCGDDGLVLHVFRRPERS